MSEATGSTGHPLLNGADGPRGSWPLNQIDNEARPLNDTNVFRARGDEMKGVP